MRCYPIPEEATSGKESVRIHLSSPTGTLTGGLFYAYMMSSEEDATGIKEIENRQIVNRKSSNSKCFDLSGRMVNGQWSNGQLPRGICIIGGRKVAMK